jgi:hypothetical protein
MGVCHVNLPAEFHRAVRRKIPGMSIRAKITVLAFALLALLAVVGGIALDGLSRVHGELRSLHRDILPLDTMIEKLVREEIEREAALYGALRASLQDGSTGATDPKALARLLEDEAKAVDGLVSAVSDHGPLVEHLEIKTLLKAPSETLVLAAGTFTDSARAVASALRGGDRSDVRRFHRAGNRTEGRIGRFEPRHASKCGRRGPARRGA